jgi:hypothetical protein
MRIRLSILFFLVSFFVFSQKSGPKYKDMSPYKDGMKWVNKGGQKGLLDADGKEIIPCKYSDIRPYTLDLFWIYNSGKMGLYSANDAKEVIPCKYDDVKPEEANRFRTTKSGVSKTVEIKFSSEDFPKKK